MDEREEKRNGWRSLEEQGDGGNTLLPPDGGNRVAARGAERKFGGAGRRTRYIAPYSPKQRILLLDTMMRSGLPAKEFAEMVGISTQTLSEWRKRFEEEGAEGLAEKRGPKEGSRMAEATKRAILMMKRMHAEWGCERISLMLGRGPGLGASPNAVGRVLREAGYEAEESQVPVHRDQPRRFERARPGQLWQTDIFSFMLKRQNRRVYLVAFLDDHSRYIVGYGLHASMSTALVIETFRAAVSAYGAPEALLSDQRTESARRVICEPRAAGSAARRSSRQWPSRWQFREG